MAPKRLLLEGPAIEPLLEKVWAEHGPDVTIVKAERVRVGGVAGFFAREQFEVTVEVPDTAVSTTPAPPPAARATTRPAVPATPAAAARPPAPAAPSGLEALLAAAEQEDADRGPRRTAPAESRHADFDAVFGSVTSPAAVQAAAQPAPAPVPPVRPAPVVDLTDDAEDPWVDGPVPVAAARRESGPSLLPPSPPASPPSDLAERLAAAWAAQSAQQTQQAAAQPGDPAPTAPAEELLQGLLEEHPAAEAPPSWQPLPAPGAGPAADVDDLLAGLAHGLLADRAAASAGLDASAPQQHEPQHYEPQHYEPLVAAPLDADLPAPVSLPVRRPGRSFAPLPDAAAPGYALERSAVLGGPEAQSHAGQAGHLDHRSPHHPDHRLPDRLATLGVPTAWLWDLPLERSAALRELSLRLASAAAARPSRRGHLAAVADPVVVVLADLEDALPVADQLATGMGLDADDVVVMSRRLRGSAPQRCLPSRQELHDAVADARAQRRSLVVVLPAPVGAPPQVRASVADTLDQLAPDEVWAVVDATRRVDDTGAWLTAVSGDRGVDALALVNTEVTSAPAAALALQAPVVLVGDRHATPEAWVSLLAARLAEQDLR